MDTSVGLETLADRLAVRDFSMYGFDGAIPSITGQQITLSSSASDVAFERLSLFEESARDLFISQPLGGNTKECRLVAQGTLGGQYYELSFNPDSGLYDSSTTSSYNSDDLRKQLKEPGSNMTFTCELLIVDA